jgi:hypothetical protein
MQSKIITSASDLFGHEANVGYGIYREPFYIFVDNTDDLNVNDRVFDYRIEVPIIITEIVGKRLKCVLLTDEADLFIPKRLLAKGFKLFYN